MSNAAEFAVTLLPANQRVLCRPGDTLLEAARRSGVRITADCGGRGRCRSCAVRVEGSVPPACPLDQAGFSADEIEAGWRRACQLRLAGECTVHLPVRAEPVVRKTLNGDLPAPAPVIDPVLVSTQDGFWRRGGLTVGPVSGGRALGLAVDLGTTNIEAALLDMSSGEVIAVGSEQNPQTAFGADIITRIGRSLESAELAGEMGRVAANAIAALADSLTGGNPEGIAEVAVAGNPVMQHLLLGLPLTTLARVPYQPAIYDAADCPAAEVGLPFAPGARLYFGPNIAGFIGSDHVAALLEVTASPPAGSWAVLDVGTNTEISLRSGGRITSVSCASGPAFEGGMLSCGMRAAAGAVTRVEIAGAELKLETIAGEEAVGICGSGVLSLVSELHRAGAVNARGRLSLEHPRVRERACQREFVLAEYNGNGGLPVVFTQQDVRAVQLAKAAIRTGLDFLLENAGLAAESLGRVILAGVFGRHIGIREAISIDMLPDIPLNRFDQAGNIAAAGVRRLLVCNEARRNAAALARQAAYLDLASQPGFRTTFARRTCL